MKLSDGNYQVILEALAHNDFRKATLRKALLFKGRAREELFNLSRERRENYFPSKRVEIRSVIEVSNVCRQSCNFCNINRSFRKKRYTINYENLLKIVERVYYRKKRRVLLLQSGENRSRNYINLICRSVKGIKQRFNDLTVILCLGNLDYEQYKRLKEAGADRYVLKFETSNPKLYRQIKPNDSLTKRVECINQLIDLGFEVGSGNIVGLPGQSIQDLINDLLFISSLKLTMVSASIFIPGEDSKYSQRPIGDLDITLNYMALMRIMYPQMLIPSTSSLEKARRGGQYLGLMAGANTVTIHDGTPRELKKHFPIYSVNRFTPNEEFLKSIVARAHLYFG